MAHKRFQRLVVVTRLTPLEQLIHRCGTRGQAEFYLSSRGQTIAWFERLHDRLLEGLRVSLAAVPAELPYVRVERNDLDRFLFNPDDLVMVVGQDGLVANLAKYLRGQWCFGVNPDPENYDGVLCPHLPARVRALLNGCLNPEKTPTDFFVQERTLAQAVRDDGQVLYALNEVFVGHQSHQSARYRLSVAGVEERQSSSGLIVATGTGSTGWTRSITSQRGIVDAMPGVTEEKLAWFVREPWPSVATGTALNFGLLNAGQPLDVVSEMGEGGVIFADGVESDYLEFGSGQSVRIGLAPHRLSLLMPQT